MNGRSYDPKLGRFLSVDPFIQSPTNTQSVNPYTYIFNNPLSGVDPTGYKVETIECSGSDGRSACESFMNDLKGKDKGSVNHTNGFESVGALIAKTLDGFKGNGENTKVNYGKSNKNDSNDIAGATAIADWIIDNPDLESSGQTLNLSPEEKKRRLSAMSIVNIDASHLPSYLKSEFTDKAQNWLYNFALTDKGAELLAKYTGESINVILNKGSGSGLTPIKHLTLAILAADFDSYNI